MNILPLAYLGNIQYYTKLCFTDCVIDAHEHFVKQSYRTRCDLLGANDVISLAVPTVKTPNDLKSSIKDTRIDYSKRWQHRHWESIRSAYRQSPYFEHYEERFASFYTQRYDFLFDLNRQLTELTLELLGSNVKFRYSDQYIDPQTLSPADHDFRDTLSPKPRLWRPDPRFAPQPYYQVFSERRPFVPNLSILDLLCCEGPHALAILRASIR